jgi:hypothetical protein
MRSTLFAVIAVAVAARGTTITIIVIGITTCDRAIRHPGLARMPDRQPTRRPAIELGPASIRSTSIRSPTVA